ncbi:MAG: amidohydrolase family protein [Planctomycetes bacterium]|nr:amidohydrolase family protein [Planctomycetota bacterium]
MILRARQVLTAGHRLLDNGAVRIEDGVIAEVGPRRDLGGGPVEDLGDCLLMPGFVNAHIHLELTHLAGKVPAHGGLFDWLVGLVEQIVAGGDDPEVVRQSVRTGRDLCLAVGVTTVGDISRLTRLTRSVLADGPLRVLSFGEVIAVGKLRDRLNERLDAAADATHRSRFLEVGLSPHSPYSLEPDAFAACARRATADGLRMCVHLAETAEEAAFTTALTGEVRDYLQRCGFWDDRIPCPGRSPVACAAAAGVLGPATVLAHVNYVDDDEIDRLAAAGVHVAYCPRTHAAFGQPPHRFAEMLDRGINVCLGTDSLASNPDLSILGELRFLRETLPGCSSQRLIEMATIRGARALGFEKCAGSLAAGKAADLVVVPLDRAADDRWDSILTSVQPPAAVYVAGQKIDIPR